MAKCVICKREIDTGTHLLILSHGVEVNFYSRDCVKKYIEIEERFIQQNQSSYRISETKSKENPGFFISIEQKS